MRAGEFLEKWEKMLVDIHVRSHQAERFSTYQCPDMMCRILNDVRNIDQEEMQEMLDEIGEDEDE